MLSASDLNQLTVLLALATLLFIAASALRQTVAATLLMIIVPYEAVDTRFGSSTMVLVYVVFMAMLLRKEQVRLPMLPRFLFLLLWYLVCMSLMHPSTYMQHAVYIATLVAAFLVFWLCYDLVNRLNSLSDALNVFVVMNVGVAIYCALQFMLGPGESYNLFGLDYIHMNRVREDRRITGPFQSSEITAQYLAMMQFVILHQVLAASSRWRKALIALAGINCAIIIATGSRGELLLLIGGFAIYLWLFRHRLGLARSIALGAGGALVLTATALIVVSTTEFDEIFQRLAQTEFNEQGIPDTRQVVWPAAWQEIVKEPIIGHGPRLRFFREEQGIRYEEHVFIPHPHSLYLFLLFTVGVPGLILFMWILWTIGMRCWRAMSNKNGPPELADFARTGVILVVLFVLDGIKMEQMRLTLADFWFFWFGLCGVLIAACDRVEGRVRAPASVERTAPIPEGQLVPSARLGSGPQFYRQEEASRQ